MDDCLTAVSACLLGFKCRYNGKAKPAPWLEAQLGENYLTICPEAYAFGGKTREPSEISGGDGADVLDGRAKVLSKSGEDLSAQFIRGAEHELKRCLLGGVTKAYLQAKSPSCGYGRLYDGSFCGAMINGNGVFAELLVRNAIEVVEVEGIKETE